MPRLAGKQGSVYISQGGIGLSADPSHKIADIFNITFEAEIETVACGVKLEVNETYALGAVNCRLTCERYITDSVTNITTNPEVGASVALGNFQANVPASGNNYLGRTLQWQFLTIDGATTKGFIVTGEGFLERVSQNGPRGAVSEVWEIRCTNSPSLGFAN
jgi:hypothetical protein